MNSFPFWETASFLDRFPIRVSTQCLRQKNYPHMHEHIQICYVLSGTLKHTICNKEYIQEADSCSFILPYMNHMTDLVDSEDTPVVVFISFRSDFMQEHGYNFFPYFEDKAHFENRAVPKLCEFTDEMRDTAREYIHAMINEFAKEKDVSHNLLAELLAKLIRISCSDDIRKNATQTLRNRIEDITKAVQYVINNYASKIDIENTAKLCNMSRSTFTKNFRAVTGMSFVDFVTSVRIKNALLLRKGTIMSLDEIAEKCGLYDRTNLTRVFQRTFSMSVTQLCDYHKTITNKNTNEKPLSLSWLYENE